jgi:hypothetical protein
MSHGADTEDFEKSICNLPPGGLDVSVAFLLESPGGDSSLGEKIEYKAEGITKRPPVGQYYWTTPQPENLSTPQEAKWPKDSSELKNQYGDYFAYLIWTHKFHNAYFTNIVKCNLTKRDGDKFIRYEPDRDAGNRDYKILNNCYNRFLIEEMRIVKPQIVFYFGLKAAHLADYAGLHSLLSGQQAAQMVTLWHPAACRSQSQIISHNDELIRDALNKRKQTQPTNTQL